MKLYLFLAIVVCESCNYFSHAEYDSLVDWAGPGPVEAPDDLFERAALAGLEWSPYGRPPWTSAAKRSAKADIQTRRRSALDKNFMRFGRTDPHAVRQSRASNLMRFGRPDRNFLRFGRDGWAGEALEEPAVALPDLSKEYATSTEQLEPQPVDAGAGAAKRNAAGGASEELPGGAGLSESGEQIRPKQIVYYRRDSPKNLMRFGKRRASGYMRFGRANLMRFGRRSDEPDASDVGERVPLLLVPPFGRVARAGPSNLMRFGRAGNLMRFGRSGSTTAAAAEPGTAEGNSVRNGTASLRSTEDGGATPPRTLPTNLLELLDGDRLVPGMSKDQERLLLDAMELDGAVARAAPPEERVPLYVVEK